MQDFYQEISTGIINILDPFLPQSWKCLFEITIVLFWRFRHFGLFGMMLDCMEYISCDLYIPNRKLLSVLVSYVKLTLSPESKSVFLLYPRFASLWKHGIEGLFCFLLTYNTKGTFKFTYSWIKLKFYQF